ncbi:hypothetical protein BJV77DRAFT_968015 [Russula vinacea]|nr:hypothetical protein BJV77DRAFT_968015 [Russula vinacea]
MCRHEFHIQQWCILSVTRALRIISEGRVFKKAAHIARLPVGIGRRCEKSASCVTEGCKVKKEIISQLKANICRTKGEDPHSSAPLVWESWIDPSIFPIIRHSPVVPSYYRRDARQRRTYTSPRRTGSGFSAIRPSLDEGQSGADHLVSGSSMKMWRLQAFSASVRYANRLLGYIRDLLKHRHTPSCGPAYELNLGHSKTRCATPTTSQQSTVVFEGPPSVRSCSYGLRNAQHCSPGSDLTSSYCFHHYLMIRFPHVYLRRAAHNAASRRDSQQMRDESQCTR